MRFSAVCARKAIQSAAIGLALCLAGLMPSARADITTSGDVRPTSPAPPDWDASTVAYIGYLSSGNLTVGGTSALASGACYIGSTPGIDGSVVVSGASASWANTDSVYLGPGSTLLNGGSGELSILDGARVSTTSVFVGCTSGGTNVLGGGTGHVEVAGVGSTWTVGNGSTGTIYVGGNIDNSSQGGIGLLTIETGGSVAAQTAYIGAGSGGTGTVVVNGANGGATLSLSDGVVVGHHGEGTMRVLNGGTVNANLYCSIGGRHYWDDGSQSQGTVLVDGPGSTLNVARCGSLLIGGAYGTGSLTVTNGGRANFDDDFGIAIVAIGQDSKINVGNNATVEVSNCPIIAGGDATHAGGTLAITGGTFIINTTGGGFALQNSDENSTPAGISVNGGRLLNCGGTIGAYDKYEVTNGGTATGNRYVVRPYGLLSANGSGTKLSSTDFLYVSGSAKVENGATMEIGGDVALAGFGDAATIDVGGATPTTLTVAKSLLVGWNYDGGGISGRSGPAQVTIQSGGIVQVAETTYAQTNRAGDRTECGVVDIHSGGTLTTRTYIGPAVSGGGTINVNGIVSDGSLVFDGSVPGHGLSQTLVYRDGTIAQVDMTDPSKNGDLGAGCKERSSISIQNGIQVTSANGYLGYAAPDPNLPTNTASQGIVTGADSAWTVTGNMYVSYRDNGDLRVENGGRVSADALLIGHNGLNSYDSNRRGSLTIENGGTVVDREAWVDGNAIANYRGTATISGSGSSWTTMESLNIGYGAVAQTGGTLIVGSDLTVGSSGRYTISGGTATVGSLFVDDGGTASINGGRLTCGDLWYLWGSPTFEFGGGTLAAACDFDSSMPITVTGEFGNASIDTNGHNVTLSGRLSAGSGGIGGLTKLGGGTLVLSGANTYVGTTVLQAGGLFLDSNAYATVLDTTHGGVDIQGGQLVFDYDTNADPVTTIRANLRTSYVLGGGTGPLNSGPMYTSTGSLLGYGIGYLDDATTDTVTAKVAVYGDTDLSGTVDTDDLFNLLASLGQPGIWQTGDLDYNGVVNTDDLFILTANMGNSITGISERATLSPHATSVPEPSAMMLLATGIAVALLTCARRKW